MKDRLQFRHHEEIFETRGEAINYIYSEIALSRGEMQNKDYKNAFSLLAEPTILRYKNVDDETNPHIMLAIGSNSNNTTYPHENRYCIIDIDNTESEIAALDEKISEAISALTISTIDSNTIDFTTTHEDGGTVISGDVKVPQYNLFPDGRVYNNIIKTENGIFLHVNARYDEDTNIFTFEVNDDIIEFRIGNDSLVSGEYKTNDESLHLKMKSGNEITVDLENLIKEWTVEEEASRTPIVLTRERAADGDNTSANINLEPWQDVLRADVRIDPNIPHNILTKSSNGQFLSVNGIARNIAYWSGTTEINVQEALDVLSKIKLSTDSANILTNKIDGMFANATLEYEASNNRLVFKTSSSNGEKVVNIDLNTVRIDDEHTSYDSTTEILSIPYIDGKGQYTYAKINLGALIRDWEWSVNNYGHNVELQKDRSIEGSDQLSADVVIRKDKTNILEDIDHQLYVGGTADNIIYEQLVSGNITVKDKIDDLEEKTAVLDETDESILATIGCYSPVDTIEQHIFALENGVADKVGDIAPKDSSIDVSGEKIQKQIKVNIGDTTSDGKANIIKLNTDGLFANVDLTYDSVSNKLIFSTTNGSKEIALDSTSVIDKIYYDAANEAIVIEYTVNGKRMPDVIIPVRDLINEIDVADTSTVNLTKTIASGTVGPDIITAEVVLNQVHNDNILVNDGGLYVSGSQIETNKNNIASLQTRASVAEERINTVSGQIITESERAIAKEAELNTNIGLEKSRAEIVESNIMAQVSNEATRAQDEESRIEGKVDAEISRAQAAETVIDNKVDTEISRAQAAEATLESKINDEKVRALSAETALETSLNNKINTEISDRVEAVSNEKNRAMSAETALQTAITSETTRATNAENTLSTRITSENERAIAAENVINNAVSSEATRAITSESALQTAITNEATTRENAINEVSTSILAEKTRAQGEESRIDAKVDALADDTTYVVKNSNSITLTKEEEERGTSIKGDLNISSNSGNIIKLETNGVYANVNLEYDETSNKLTFSTTNGSKEIALISNSLVERVYYNAAEEKIIIVYRVNGEPMPDVVIPVRDLISEIDVQSTSSVELIKTTSISGTDIITANVNINQVHEDNLLVNDGGLYVSGAKIAQNTEAIDNLSNTVEALDNKVDTVQNALDAEILRSTNRDGEIADSVNQERVERISQDAALNSSIGTLSGNINEIQSQITTINDTLTTNYATKEYVGNYTYDKATIDSKVASGGSFDPSEYYNKTATDALLSEKLDVTAYTPTDLSDYYKKNETSGKSEISDALDLKVNQSDVVTAITTLNSGSTNPISTKVVAENEQTVTSALTKLNSDMANYYKNDNFVDSATVTWVKSGVGSAQTISANATIDMTQYYTKSQVDALIAGLQAQIDSINAGEY